MLALQELLVFCRSTLRDFFDVAQSSFAVFARTGFLSCDRWAGNRRAMVDAARASDFCSQTMIWNIFGTGDVVRHMSILTSINSGPITIDKRRLVSALQDHIADRAFPCVGAKSATNSGMLEVITAWSIQSAWDDVAIHKGLLDWSRRYETEESGFRSLAVVFSEPGNLGSGLIRAARR